MGDNWDKLNKAIIADSALQKYIDTKFKKMNNVLKDPDGYNSGIASDSRVSKVEEKVDELAAWSHPPVDFTNRLDSLHDKIDRVLELLERLTSEPSTNVYGDDDWATPSE